jgi:hypothetical protein
LGDYVTYIFVDRQKKTDASKPAKPSWNLQGTATHCVDGGRPRHQMDPMACVQIAILQIDTLSFAQHFMQMRQIPHT